MGSANATLRPGSPVSRRRPVTRTLLSQWSGTSVPSERSAERLRHRGAGDGRPAPSACAGSRPALLAHFRPSAGGPGRHPADGTPGHAEASSGMDIPIEKPRNPCRFPLWHGFVGSGCPKPMPEPASACPGNIRRETGEVTDGPGASATPPPRATVVRHRPRRATVAREIRRLGRKARHGGAAPRNKRHGGAAAGAWQRKSPTKVTAAADGPWDRSTRPLGQKCPGGGTRCHNGTAEPPAGTRPRRHP